MRDHEARDRDPVLHSSPGTVTRLLECWNEGDLEAAEKVVALVYEELHRIASAYFRSERSNHTLQATAVLNEALLRLIERKNLRWENGAHFIGVAARMMRNILVDHARERRSLKRGGGYRQVTLHDADGMVSGSATDLLALDQALSHLASVDEQKVKVIELRYFAGLTALETSRLLQISEATVHREWRRARAWLYGELHGGTVLGT